MITVKDVRKIIDSAENILTDCYETLIQFKHGCADTNKILDEFQPKLAEVLYELMQFYQKLHKDKDDMISQKSIYSEKSFSTLMKENALFLNIVKKTIQTGKCLGDAYMWFFFKDNRVELEKHFEHESTGLYVAGIGGLGELEFIKNTQSINGCYVLYHGISTMLRIGDFSLYDPDNGIVGVGEIKTKMDGDALNVHASITGKIKNENRNNSVSSEGSMERCINKLQKNFPRIRKQLISLDALMKAKDSDMTSSSSVEFEYDIVNSLTVNNRVTINSDKSLALVASWRNEESLFDRLYVADESEDPPEGFVEKCKLLMYPESEYNAFFVGDLNIEMNAFSIPVLWWNIDDKICRDLYFYKLNIITIFNPERLLRYYINDGFTVSTSSKLNQYKIIKSDSKQHIEVGNFASVCYLITNGFMKTKDVYESATYVLKILKQNAVNTNTKVDLHMRLDNFGVNRNNDYK